MISGPAMDQYRDGIGRGKRYHNGAREWAIVSFIAFPIWVLAMGLGGLLLWMAAEGLFAADPKGAAKVGK